MPRAKGGYKSRHRRNKIRKAAKGFRGGRSKLWKAAVVAQSNDDVVVLASLSTSVTESEPPDPDRATMRYELKREDGVWKIDDLAIIFDPDKPPMTSAKSLFSAPERYLQ